MSSIILALIASVSVAGGADAAQPTPRRPASVSPAAATSTYPVTINIPQANIYSNLNPGHAPLIIVARCNATVGPKDLEGWVTLNGPATVQNMVASQSGTQRQSITFVVPWGWYYQVNVAIPSGGICSATAWLAN
jgi:hypothetical protein